MKLATATQARTYSQIGARSSAQQNNNPPSELDNLIGPEPGAPGPDVYKSALKGAAIGVAAGAAYGLVGRLGYSVGSIPQGGAIQFGTVMASTVGGALALGPSIEPSFDRGTSLALGGITGLGFSVISTTLGVASGPVTAAAYGGLMGAALGFTQGMLHSQN